MGRGLPLGAWVQDVRTSTQGCSCGGGDGGRSADSRSAAVREGGDTVGAGAVAGGVVG